MGPTNPITLQRFEDRQFFTTTTSDDPIIQKLAAKNSGTVFATDTILGALMAAPLSAITWDIIVRKHNGKIFLDKRSNSRLDFWSVNENESDSLPTDPTNLNSQNNLSLEATLINHNFSQQVLAKDPAGLAFEESNPFSDAVDLGNQPASLGYLYKRWDLTDDIKLVARCEINAAYRTAEGETSYMSVKALNEFDHHVTGGMEWRRTVDKQASGVIANEMKTNSSKLARWTAQAILAGADHLLIG